MFVNTATFEIGKIHKEILEKKREKDKEKLAEARGLISFECWKRENTETVEFVYVSKWESQSDFKAWISREDHVNEHKQMNKKRKENLQLEQVKMKKTLRAYELYDSSEE
ncbi:antibiotic biosynthesis monooxygenase family protein [Metabacillus halosaccharovorans]|uniref:antibiotic biosynthesis monooxygenase family protein n=1 Tax=Metabacillus halosaccharovorans TaxID=930124 RepID=UPI00204052FB|nr:antibiotic biosynthesis monooxygenase [Metabacillus halosaccharovorans]MCM3444580.1 antibiotic biosynthesis monooxygenase [Metabacillus halosaccharovorans]